VGIALSGLSGKRPESDPRTGLQTAPSRRSSQQGAARGPPAFRIARNSNLAAISSLEELPRALMSLRNARCRLSIALFVSIILRMAALQNLSSIRWISLRHRWITWTVTTNRRRQESHATHARPLPEPRAMEGRLLLEYSADSPSGCSQGLAQGDERSEETACAAIAFFEAGAAEPGDETRVAILVGNV